MDLMQIQKIRFGVKYITPLVAGNTDQSLCNDYEVLSEGLLKLKQEIRKLDEQRQLSVHYHEGIVKVYNMLHDLNPIEEFQKLYSCWIFYLKFLILHQMPPCY